MQKRAKKVAKKPIQRGEPKFNYTSKCCNAQAVKPPVTAFGMDSEEAKTQGLGTWRCSQCRKKCSCIRTKGFGTEKILQELA